MLAAVARDLGPSTIIEARVLITSGQARAFYLARGYQAAGEETVDILDGVDAPALELRADGARLRATPG